MIIPQPFPVTFPTFSVAIGGLMGASTPSTLMTEGTLTSNHTLITKYQAGALHSVGNCVRLLLAPPLTVGKTCVINNCWLGKPAASGDAWDFLSGNPVRITFDGNNGATLTAGGDFTYSDVINYTLDDAPLIIAFDVASGSTVKVRTGLSTSLYTSYFKAATNEAGTENKGSGYTAVGGYGYMLHVLQAGIL